MRRQSLWPYGLFFTVLILVASPFSFLILGSFSTAGLPTDFSISTLSLDNYAKVYRDPETYDLAINTLVYVAGSVTFAVSVAFIMAYLMERTNLPLKALFYAIVPMSVALPSMLMAMAWILLLSPRIGLINRILQQSFGFTDGPINIYSLGGMIFIEGLRLVPTAFLMLIPLVRSTDPALEEAAAASGASPKSTLRKITLPLLAPGLLAVIIYQSVTALSIFEIPGVLGLPAGIYVFSTKIYSLVHSTTFPPPYGQATALAMFYVIVAVSTTYFYSRVIRRAEKFATVTGKGYRPRLRDLGRWRYPAVGLALLYVLLAIVLPFIILLYSSFLPYLQAPSLESFRGMSLKNYLSLLDYQDAGVAVKNTLIMAVITATSTTLLSFFVSLVVVRSQMRGRKLLDQLAFVPHAIPGIVMGLAFFWVFFQLEFLPIYGTIWAISIAFTVNFLSYGTRTMNAGILQIHKDLEEAAYLSGASPLRTMRRVFFPLMLPTFAGIWIWVVLHAVHIAGTPLILYEGSRNQVLAVLIWNMWDWGRIGEVAAIGSLLILVLATITLVVRFVGFRKLAA
jgi:iron(III) transport system permease protein